MLRIACPYCGERDYTEFVYGGDAGAARPRRVLETTDQQWKAFLYQRDNPAGVHMEYWQHSYGCRLWLKVIRDTVTHDIVEVGGYEATGEECP